MLQRILKRIRSGDLLLEMLVVITVIVLAVSYALPRYLEIRDSAVEAARTASAKNIAEVTAALIKVNELALPAEGEKTLVLSATSADSDAQKIVGCLTGLSSEDSGAPVWTVTIGADGSVKVKNALDAAAKEYAADNAS